MFCVAELANPRHVREFDRIDHFWQTIEDIRHGYTTFANVEPLLTQNARHFGTVTGNLALRVAQAPAQRHDRGFLYFI